MSRISPWISVVLWVLVIFTLSSIPGDDEGPTFFPGFDKIAHFIEYGILGFLLARAGRWQTFTPVMVIVYGAVAGLIVGGADELYQRWTPGRVSDVLDASMDAIGCVSGALIRRQWVQIKH